MQINASDDPTWAIQECGCLGGEKIMLKTKSFTLYGMYS
jgi:hypothetical protein